MDKETHIAHHKRLHKALDELVGDYISSKNFVTLSDTSIMDLIEWSHQQTINPTEPVL